MAEHSPFISTLKESFRRVKIDVNALWFANENIQKQCGSLDARLKRLEEAVLAVKASRPREAKLVGSKLSSKVHEDRCVFARNIEKENLVVFPSIPDAVSKGMEKCPCLT